MFEDNCEVLLGNILEQVSAGTISVDKAKQLCSALMNISRNRDTIIPWIEPLPTYPVYPRYPVWEDTTGGSVVISYEQ